MSLHTVVAGQISQQDLMIIKIRISLLSISALNLQIGIALMENMRMAK